VSHRRALRPRHGGQRGITLIELLVTIAVMAVGVVGITSSFATIQTSAHISQDQSALEVTMRNIDDYLRTTAPYQWCAPTTATYDIPTTVIGVSALKVAPAVTLTTTTRAFANGVAEPPLYDCSGTTPISPQTGTTCPSTSTYCDWGVQRLTVTITSTTGRTLTRVVFKSFMP
jgi:prepilin-type N-terminal cleavage/methylation domain-containing protein